MNPVIWMLVALTVATAALLIDRRRKSRPLSLDDWAEQQGRPVIREVELALLSEVEPLALLPEVFGVERFLPARSETEAALFLCLCGRGHRPQSMLLAVLSAPDWLPHLRILPKECWRCPKPPGICAEGIDCSASFHRVEAFAELDPAPIGATASVLPLRVHRCGSSCVRTHSGGHRSE